MEQQSVFNTAVFGACIIVASECNHCVDIQSLETEKEEINNEKETDGK